MRMFIGLLLGLLVPVLQGHAQDAAALRGGWVGTDGGGRTSIYLLVVRGTVVTGTVCSNCSDPRNLEFIVDGRLEGSKVHLRVVHPYPQEPVSVDEVEGELSGSQLVLRWHGEERGEANQKTAVLRRPPRVSVPPPGAPHPQAYVPPGAPAQLAAAGLVGLWLSGNGPRKQYFIISQTDHGLLGMVCGPCDHPATMAPLDGFEIHGTQLRFDIVHEGTGDPAQGAPFTNVVHATLARNELHLSAIPSFAPHSTPYEMTLLGPVTFQPQ